MSLFDRRKIVLMLAVASLAACNFTPVYGPGGVGNVIRGRVLLADPTTRLGFVFVGRVEDRIGAPDTPAYALSYSITTSQRNLAITGADNINRVNVVGDIDFAVTETATGVQVQAGTVSTFTAYATTGSPVATAAARRDAEDRLMIALADQLVSRLLAGAASWE